MISQELAPLILGEEKISGWSESCKNLWKSGEIWSKLNIIPAQFACCRSERKVFFPGTKLGVLEIGQNHQFREDFGEERRRGSTAMAYEAQQR